MSTNFWDDPSAGVGALKAGFLGFGKSGKTFTAVLLACAAREVLGLSGPIALYDTETGSLYLRPAIKTITGKEPLVKRSRSFDDLLAFGQNAHRVGASAAVVDSITHPWRELCTSYLASKPADKRFMNPKDWSIVKGERFWGKWSDFYLTTTMSLITCGRAGWDMHTEKDDDGKQEFVRDGIKMKTEGEFAFEPSLLVEMEQMQQFEEGGKVPKISRRAVVLGDRFNVLDGASCTFPSTSDVTKAYDAVKKFFGPHLALLSPGATGTVNVSTKTTFDGESAGNDEAQQKSILLEEIKADLVIAHPDRSESSNAAKKRELRECFGTAAWEKVGTLTLAQLTEGRAKLRALLAPPAPVAPVAIPEPELPTIPPPVTVPDAPATGFDF